MTPPDTLRDIARSFQEAGVRWLVVGGYAVVAHGFVRFTQDLDLVLDLSGDNARKAMTCLECLGFRPRIPEPMARFADAECRRVWHDEREMIVFTVWRQSDNGLEQVDLFIREPFPVAEALRDAWLQTTADGTIIPSVDLKRLLAMKAEAGRPKDLEDIRELTTIGRQQGRLP